MSKYVVVSGWVLCCWCVRVKRDRPPLPRTVGWLVNAQLSTPRCNNGAFSSGIGNELEIRIRCDVRPSQVCPPDDVRRGPAGGHKTMMDSDIALAASTWAVNASLR